MYKRQKKFYVNATDRYVVSFPVSVDIVRKNGTVYRREDWLASTAVSLGEIEIKLGASEHDELVEVKRRTHEFLATLSEVDGEKIILPGYETHILDTQREIEYNKLSISQQGNVEATLHRPLRHGRPWRFTIEGVSQDAFEDTDGKCVPYQLAKHLRQRGKMMFSQEELTNRLQDIADKMYEGEDDPYLSEKEGEVVKMSCAEAGVTTAIVVDCVVLSSAPSILIARSRATRHSANISKRSASRSEATRRISSKTSTQRSTS